MKYLIRKAMTLNCGQVLYLLVAGWRLRTLINSTGLKLEKVEFPGNDDSERSGWDGLVEAGEATPWIQLGKSGWEFGVNQDPKGKADKDYAKSLKHVPEDERKDTTFVFVTPRRWSGKATWEKER